MKIKLALAMLVSMMIFSSDMSMASGPSEWAKKEVGQAKEYDLLTEKLEANYRDSITREEFAELAVNLYRSLSSEELPTRVNTYFKDTDNSDVLIAGELGIINGVGNDLFAPKENISREQICTMIYRTLEILYPEIDTSSYQASLEDFSDSEQISDWARESVELMVGLEIIKGMDDNTIVPLGITSKEQAIVIVLRTFISPTISELTSPSIEILDVESQKDEYYAGDTLTLDISIKNRAYQGATIWVGCSLENPLGDWVDIEPIGVDLSEEMIQLSMTREVEGLLTGDYRPRVSIWDEKPSLEGKTPVKIDQFDLNKDIGIYRNKEYFNSWNEDFWSKRDGFIGRSTLNPENVVVDDNGLKIRMPANSLEGGEVRTRRNEGFGSYEISMKLPDSPSSITGFFFYRPPDLYNEIDIEVFNQKNSELWLTTYENGKIQNEYKEPLWFDPTSDYHTYRIDYYSNGVSFYIDGERIQTWTSGFSKKPMRLMLNSWYPTWLDGTTSQEDGYLKVEWIKY